MIWPDMATLVATGMVALNRGMTAHTRGLRRAERATIGHIRRTSFLINLLRGRDEYVPSS